MKIKVIKVKHKTFRERLADFWYEHCRFPVWLRDAFWWVRHRIDPRHRYHVAKTGLRPGYYDPDVRILATIATEFMAWAEHPETDLRWHSREQNREMTSSHSFNCYLKAGELVKWFKEHGTDPTMPYGDGKYIDASEFKEKCLEVMDISSILWY